jgi:hypothetical protein
MYYPKGASFKKGENVSYTISDSVITLVNEGSIINRYKVSDKVTPIDRFIKTFKILKKTNSDSYYLESISNMKIPDNWQIDFSNYDYEVEQVELGFIPFQDITTSNTFILKASVSLNSQTFTKSYLDRMFNVKH